MGSVVVIMWRVKRFLLIACVKRAPVMARRSEIGDLGLAESTPTNTEIAINYKKILPIGFVGKFCKSFRGRILTSIRFEILSFTKIEILSLAIYALVITFTRDFTPELYIE